MLLVVRKWPDRVAQHDTIDGTPSCVCHSGHSVPDERLRTRSGRWPERTPGVRSEDPRNLRFRFWQRQAFDAGERSHGGWRVNPARCFLKGELLRALPCGSGFSVASIAALQLVPYAF